MNRKFKNIKRKNMALLLVFLALVLIFLGVLRSSFQTLDSPSMLRDGMTFFSTSEYRKMGYDNKEDYSTLTGADGESLFLLYSNDEQESYQEYISALSAGAGVVANSDETVAMHSVLTNESNPVGLILSKNKLMAWYIPDGAYVDDSIKLTKMISNPDISYIEGDDGRGTLCKMIEDAGQADGQSKDECDKLANTSLEKFGYDSLDSLIIDLAKR